MKIYKTRCQWEDCDQKIEFPVDLKDMLYTCPACNRETYLTAIIDPPLIMPPVIATTAFCIRREDIIKANRTAEFVLLLIGLFTICTYGIGILFIIIAIVVSLTTHDKKTVYYTCGKCGNEILYTSTICPTCKINLIK